MNSLALTARRSLQGGRTFVRTLGSLGMAHVPIAWRYARGRPFPCRSDREHLMATLAWLCKAQEVSGGSGVSAAFSLRDGWDVPYPETSGYIIGTFLASADYLGEKKFFDRARRIGDWEISIQASNGGVYSRPGGGPTRVFNTGQVILGWCSLFEQTEDEQYLDAARRAGTYLVSLQEPDGTWRRDTYCGPRTYHARVDWGLLRLAKLTGDFRYAESAKRNLRWVLAQRQDNGWFKNCGFHEEDPITHVIDYTLIGLLECALLDSTVFDRSPAVLIAQSASAICTIVENSKVGGVASMIPASFDSLWVSRDNHSCLTGNAQLAYTLLRLHGLTGVSRYESCADLLIAALKCTQTLSESLENVCGGLPGSFPMCRGYLPNSFPNWGAKFFADALLASLMRAKGCFVAA